ncbi:TonB-dependent receptor family protein [Fusobacterium mortiferum]|uniref:TonB-dependent receptor n=1 Tax=Fusobacterium mortiferum TaxID=850 RepID=A0ABS2G4V7_FUSMR|nr:TonB-dependent receptor [Fusobacterium mortiferum]MBM6875770.1 TonB-dependent receptor [Fusobacterium mortiferum]
MKKLAILSFLICASAVANAQETIHLGETVVTSMGFETTLLDEPTNISIITQEQIEEKNYKNVTEALSDNPAINIVRTKNGTAIDMRGSGESATSNVKILVDGVAINPLSNSPKGSGLDTIPMSIIERIEIAPGGGAVLYGNGVSGGVVNIITKSEFKNTGYIEGDYDSYNSKKIATGATAKVTDNLAVGVNYAGQNNRGYRKGNKGANDYIDGNIQYKLSDKHKFSLKGSRFVENETTTSMPTKLQLESDRRAKGSTYTERNITRENLTGKYEYTPNKDFNFTTTLYTTKMYNDGHTYDPKKKKNTAEDDLQETTNGVLLKANQNYENGSIIVGVDVIEGKHEGDGFSTSGKNTVPYIRDYKKDTISPYILNKYDLTEKLEFTAGFRYEWADYDLAGTDINRKFDEENKSYEGVLSYKYRDTGNIFFRYEKGFMSPTPGQLGSVEDKSKTLQSETSDTFEIGVKDYITSNTFVSLTFYRLEKDNEINSYKLEQDGPKYYDNIGKTRRNGIEFSMENYFGNLTLTSGFNYIDAVAKSDTDDYSTGDRLTDIPRFKASIGANYKFTPKFDANISYRYTGDKISKGITTPAVNVTDIGMRYRVTENLTLKAGINNVFNEIYYTTEKTDSATPADERNYYVGFKMTF